MRRFKKFTSIFLSVLLAFSVTAVSFESVSAVVDENGCYAPGDNVEATYRYYFAMPNSWLNEYTDTAGVYWWSGIDACNGIDGSGGTVTWPGYKAQIDYFVTEYYGVYYIDCPTDVPTIVWNNYVDGGTDKNNPVYSAAKQAKDANVEFCSDGDSDLYSTEWFEEMEESYNGDKDLFGEYVDNFFYDEEYGCGFSFVYDNMIYVLDPDKTSEIFDGKKIYGGDWYFYYGNGQFGTYPTKEGAEDHNTLYSLLDPIFIDDPDEPDPTYPTDPSVPDPVYPDDDEGQIHFDVKKSGWNLNTNKTFYCHIWKADGSPTSSGTDWLAWQVKKEVCSYDADAGIASFDLKITGHNFDVSDEAVYCVIFSSNTGMETYAVTMNGACIGDTLYCTGEQIENPEDSDKKSNVAVWENNPECGPLKKITSTNHVVGNYLPYGKTDATLLAEYLVAYYDDTEKTDMTQSLLDELEVSPEDVMSAVYDLTEDENVFVPILFILYDCTDPTEKYTDGFLYSTYHDGTAKIKEYDGDETELVIPSELDGYKVVKINSYAFSENWNLVSVVIPDGVTDIGTCAFENCGNLASVKIPDSVTSIHNWAFESCESLVSITIPDSVTSIGDGAFNYCTSLESVKLSKNLSSIGSFAFFATSLKNVTIPLSVTEIGEQAFGYYLVEDEGKGNSYYEKVDGFTIRGFRDSAAESYANDNGFEFEAIGDVDGNGVISVSDATLIQKYLADLSELNSEQIKSADVNGDGAVSVLDATAIQLLLVD
ncbi:MAG: leucine-rich repeat protein [Ruminococcus sp.]